MGPDPEEPHEQTDPTGVHFGKTPQNSSYGDPNHPKQQQQEEEEEKDLDVDNYDEDEDEQQNLQPYGNRSFAWTQKYRTLFPYEYARRRALSLGLRSKEEWDEYVADGKRGNGAYLPNRPDLMYASEWISWEEFLGNMRSYPETQSIVQHVLKLKDRISYELFIYENPKRAELLRIPALPWIVYETNGWIDDEHFFGVSSSISWDTLDENYT